MNKKSRIKDIINKTIFVEEEEEEEVATDVKVKTRNSKTNYFC